MRRGERLGAWRAGGQAGGNVRIDLAGGVDQRTERAGRGERIAGAAQHTSAPRPGAG